MISAVKRLVKEAAIQGYVKHETAEAFAQVAGVRIAALKNRTKQNARTPITPLYAPAVQCPGSLYAHRA